MARSFSSRLKTHLACYRRDVLKVMEDGERNGRTYEHVLSNDQRELNILPSVREGFWQWFRRHYAEDVLHRDFRHLNSSQAMAFNLFYPAIADLDDGVLLKALGIQGEVEEVCFEKVLRPKEGTNFDAYLRSTSGARCFFEIKLTEQGFGCCKDDEAHRNKLADIYRPALSRLVNATCLEPGFFFKNYQLMRNISYLHENPADRLFLIFPQANEKLTGTAAWVKRHVVEDVRPRIQIRFVEELVADCLNLSDASVWREFAGKYFCGLDGRETA